jgi:hypothetical protein
LTHHLNLPALLSLTLLLGCAAKGAARIAIDSTRTHQTINGWEATVAIDEDFLTPATRDSLIRVTVDDYGINRLRLQAQGNVIESIDHTHFPPELAVGSNDNDDPNVTVPERFWWEIFDRHVKDYVLPIKQRVEARGQPFVLNVCFVGFRQSSRFLQENPAEYVEFMLNVLRRLRDGYAVSLEPDLWEMRLEPDNGAVRVDGPRMGALLRAAGDAARQAGFNRMRFVVPSTKDPNLVPNYLRDILALPSAERYITELAYHRYRTPKPGTLESIRDLARAHGWSTSMLEHIRGDHWELAQDLTVGNVSAWAQYTLVGPHGGDNGGHYFFSDSANHTWHVGRRTLVLRQYFHYVPPGSVRIDAKSSDRQIIPAAFRRPDGHLLAVLSGKTAAEAEIFGLPAGDYAVSFAGEDGEVEAPARVTVARDEPLRVYLPGPGAVTVAPPE